MPPESAIETSEEVPASHRAGRAPDDTKIMIHEPTITQYSHHDINNHTLDPFSANAIARRLTQTLDQPAADMLQLAPLNNEQHLITIDADQLIEGSNI